MMGDDTHDAWDCEIHRAGIQAMRQRAAELRAELCASRGLTPSQACSVGCSICGVVDASPARCEFCAHGAGFERPAWLGNHSVAATEMVSAHRPAAACSPMGCDVGAPPHCARQACRCGPEGCADSSCPGRSAIQHLAAEDTEGGAL